LGYYIYDINLNALLEQDLFFLTFMLIGL